MDNEQNKIDKQIRFVAKRYKDGVLDTDKAWQQFAVHHRISRTRSSRRYWMAVASVLLLLVGIGTFYVVNLDKSEWVAITTMPGQQKDVYLPDSTLVSMAGNSTLRYDSKSYGKERRAVEMRGKSFFKVKRDASRPFSVYTAGTEVTVLGTSFQVNEQQPGTTEVNVYTGKVRFSAGEKKSEQVVLTAGMSASWSVEKKGMTIMKEENPNNLSWKTKQLRFNNTPLKQVISDLSDFYQVKITNNVESPDAKLTATFNDLPMDEVLMVINQTLDIRLAAETTE